MIAPRVVDALVSRRARRERSGLEDLTARERDVMHEMAQGKNNLPCQTGTATSSRPVATSYIAPSTARSGGR